MTGVGDGIQGRGGMDRWGEMRHLTSGLFLSIIGRKKMMVVVINNKKGCTKKQSVATV